MLPEWSSGQVHITKQTSLLQQLHTTNRHKNDINEITMSVIQDTLGSLTGGLVGNKLPTRKLGKNGPPVTALGYGTMGLSAFYGKPKPDAERFAVLDKCFELGELHWDSADMYADSEDLLGKWFKQNPGKREKIFLATKFANCSDADGNRWVDSSPEYCRKACEKSLSRLGVDHVDLCE